MSGLGSRSYPRPRNRPAATFPFRKAMLRRSEGDGETAHYHTIWDEPLHTHLRNASQVGPHELLPVNTFRKPCHKMVMSGNDSLNTQAQPRHGGRHAYHVARDTAGGHETSTQVIVQSQYLAFLIFWYIVPNQACHLFIAHVPMLRQSSMCLSKTPSSRSTPQTGPHKPLIKHHAMPST